MSEVVFTRIIDNRKGITQSDDRKQRDARISGRGISNCLLSGWQSLRVGLVRDDLPYRLGPSVLGFLSWWCRKDGCASTFLDEIYVGRYHPNPWAREAVRSDWAFLGSGVGRDGCFYGRTHSKVTAYRGPKTVLHRTLERRS